MLLAPARPADLPEVCMFLLKRLAATLAVAGTGSAVALALGLRGIGNTPGYVVVSTTLLAIGLFSSTYDIAIKEVRLNLRVVLTAVTIGALAKAILIAAVMYLIFRNPAYIAVGVAVAQIDPLSVAALRHRSRLSERGQTILSAWSAFDDPVTAILAIYLATLALHLSKNGETAASSATAVPGGLAAIGMNLLWNLVLVVSATFAWALLRFAASKRASGSINDNHAPAVALRVTGVVILIVLAFFAIDYFLMLGLAVIGLFFRPGIGPALRRVTPAAFLISIFLVGIVLIDGVSLVPGLILGGAAFGAQIVVGMLVARNLPGDRLRLAFSQQNGITAVILALLLETLLPGTVAVVAPAILVVNTIYLISAAVMDRPANDIQKSRHGGAELSKDSISSDRGSIYTLKSSTSTRNQA